MSASSVLGYVIIILLIEGYFTERCYIDNTNSFEDCPYDCCNYACCGYDSDYDSKARNTTPTTRQDSGSGIWTLVGVVAAIVGICSLPCIAFCLRDQLRSCARQSQQTAMPTTGNQMSPYPIQQTSFHQHPYSQLQYPPQHILQQQQLEQQQELQNQQQQLLQQQQQQQQQLQYQQQLLEQQQFQQQQQLQSQQQQLQQQQQYQPLSQYNQQQSPSNCGVVAASNTSAKVQSNTVAVNTPVIRNQPLSPKMRTTSRTMLVGSDEC